MKSKTKIDKQLERKTHNQLVETILLAKKNSGWLEVASLLAGPRRTRIGVNLEELDKFSDGKNKIVIVGKVLSQGNVSKKIKVVAIGFSELAKEKLLKAGCEVSTIFNEIKSNPDAKGIKVFKNTGKELPMLSKTKGVFNK